MLKIKFLISLYIIFLTSLITQSFLLKQIKSRSNFQINLIFQNETSFYNRSTIIDGNLDLPQTTPALIDKSGYPVEVHHVITEDEYILELHRIPTGKYNSSLWRKSAILVMHGYACTSINWILNTANVALPYKLAENGHDVWLGNFRGNKYSNRHLKYANNDTRFWNFSWHEMGTADLTAMIDYILQETGESSLFYVGHSMGSTAFFVMASMKAEYNKKIRAMFALAPVAFFHQIRNTAKLITPFVITDKFALNALGHGELVPAPVLDTMKIFTAILCAPDSTIAGICDQFLHHIAGTNPNQLNRTWLPLLFRNYPDSTSTRTFLHFLQEVKSGVFCQYDYGVLDNFRIYGRLKPPAYNLTKVTAPVAIYWSSNDWLASPEDVQLLAKKLPNVIVNYKVKSSSFSHLEFLTSMNSDVLLYNRMLETMEQLYQ